MFLTIISHQLPDHCEYADWISISNVLLLLGHSTTCTVAMSKPLACGYDTSQQSITNQWTSRAISSAYIDACHILALTVGCSVVSEFKQTDSYLRCSDV